MDYGSSRRTMPTYTFRSNDTIPQGAIHPVALELRVLASLEDAQQDGVAVQYDWTTADVGSDDAGEYVRSEEHTSELQSLMRTSYAVFCLKKKKKTSTTYKTKINTTKT